MKSLSINGAADTIGRRTTQSDNMFHTRLPVAGRAVLVVGGGGAALGYVAGLRNADAIVTVVAETVGTAIDDLAQRGLIQWHQRSFADSDLDDPWLVVAATGDAGVDCRVEMSSTARRIWCIRHRCNEPGSVGGGQVILVGGGPGDPGLMTVAGLAAVRNANVVVTDRLAPVSVLADLPPEVEVIDVGKVPFGRATPQEEINRILIEKACEGKVVVRLKGGDSFLFGRGGEEMLACHQAGVEVSVIPGVTSALSVPAAAGIPITHRGLTQGVTVVSGHVPPHHKSSTIDYQALARSGTTLVFLMAVTHLAAITDELRGHGLSPETPAATIANGTTANQQVVVGSLATIAELIADADIEPPAITVIGDVAKFAAPEVISPHEPGASIVTTV